jgi:large subunit ribosomal protein L10
MITRKQKEEVVEKVTEKIRQAKAIVFTDYRGLTVEEMTEIRRELRAKGVELKVMKQTLFEIAAKNAGADIDMTELSNHPVAIAFGKDEVEPAKVIYEFSKKHENLEMIGGALNGKTISIEELRSLALMPSRDEMYAKIVGSLASPLRGIVGVLQGNLRGLVSVLSQYADSRNN